MWENHDEAKKLASELAALGVSAVFEKREYDRGGVLAEHYLVSAGIADEKTGNAVRRTFRCPTNAKQAVKELAAELKALAKATRAHKRSERNQNRE